MAQRVGVVLAGGLGERLGGGKGARVIEGKTLAERAARTLSPVCATVLVSLAPGSDNPAPGFAAVFDEPPEGRGPLAGIAAAFAASGGSDLLVLACDYPRVGHRLLQDIVAAAGPEDALVFPTDPNGRDHPLVGLWRRAVEPAVRAALDIGLFKVRGLLAEVDVRRLESDDLPGHDLGRALLNVNEPGDLAGLGG